MLPYSKNKEIIIETFRYLFFGILTVIVNTLVFIVLDKCGYPILVSNTIAFVIAVQFAYMTNTKFVFHSRYTLKNFKQFWLMRIGTIFVDNIGMYVLLFISTDKIIAKCIVNIIIIGINYLCSKFIIFRHAKMDQKL